MDNLRYWLGFNLVQGIGPVRLRALLEAFGDVASAWHAPADSLNALNLDRRAIANLVALRGQVDLDALVDRVESAGVTVYTWESPDYPALLREIPDPPPVLYVRGALTPSDAWAVAMVGTRRASVYGREVAHRLAADLASAGITLVSGLARGIDAVVHRSALENGGRTLAVLGCGVDVVYPPEHRSLAAAVMENGALISDFPLGTPPDAINFPARNRIISGLSLGTIVVEAGLKSGALITADFALEQGREVFAVPGSILSPSSLGCNRLLRDGAAGVVTEARDVLEGLNLGRVPEQKAARLVLPENATEATVFAGLSSEPRHLDDLARQIDLPVEMVSSALVMMELKGMVRQVGPLQYVRAHEPQEPYVL